MQVTIDSGFASARGHLCEIAAGTAAATVVAYAVQERHAAVRRKNFDRQGNPPSAEPAGHSIHPRGRHRTGYLGSKRARVRCRS